LRIEGGAYYSGTIRKIFSNFHGVDVGLYSGIGCFVLHAFDENTSIGRYCQIAMQATRVNNNHPMNTKSIHSFFYHPAWGYTEDLLTEHTEISVGNDVWLGANSVVLPSVRQIGDGAVIGAGAVVQRDVPPYAVVVGNPGRIVRYRFGEEKIQELLEEKWWEKSIDTLIPEISNFQRPLEGSSFIR